MSLLDFETALGRLVRAPGAAAPLRSLHLDHTEASRIEILKESAGFRFTVGVQRSWCVGRASRAAPFTLSILPGDLSRRLLEDWIEAGGGTSSFFAAEAEGLLEFIASRLPDPSHELSACRFEQATLRASEQAIRFTPPALELLSSEGSTVRRGRFGGVAAFHGRADAIIDALVKRRTLPAISPDVVTTLFGPGLDRLWRFASPREAVLWERLKAPVPYIGLLREDYSHDDVAPMLREGVLELAPQ